ncbi:MAG: DUF1684 domain-containing protein [Reichenbachiella sp.]|uniref:DUF1684 domain-containing protein n=1 Tax=Reichenbachiella sp. TaxID=2184521 RepID=UPI0032649646
MRFSHTTLWILFLGCLAFKCEPTQRSLSYTEQISAHREEIEQYMNEAEDSPFLGADSLVRLDYFPADERFKVIASIKRIANPGQLTLGTSDGELRVYTKYAWLEFEIQELPQKLLVLKGQEEDGLFLAFADLTSDDSTYGGGRYINLGFSEQAEKITLDFNKAYNPYCAYNETYSCPLPPVENYLKIAVTAGERIYKN